MPSPLTGEVYLLLAGVGVITLPQRPLYEQGEAGASPPVEGGEFIIGQISDATQTTLNKHY
ncbi:MAG: hypothetical protein JRF72_11905 [Deltaproteobacteria bacterium]|jgi:hypothetical protein|nr:hypothetical protein [Deltaproteobacteria bacterium]